MFADHVVALDVDDVRLDLVEKKADFLLDFPREADPEVLVGEDAMGAEPVNRGFVTELGVALARVRTAGQHMHVVPTCSHPLGQAVAELGGTVDVRRVGIRGNQNSEGGLVGVGNGHVENS